MIISSLWTPSNMGLSRQQSSKGSVSRSSNEFAQMFLWVETENILVSLLKLLRPGDASVVIIICPGEDTKGLFNIHKTHKRTRKSHILDTKIIFLFRFIWISVFFVYFFAKLSFTGFLNFLNSIWVIGVRRVMDSYFILFISFVVGIWVDSWTINLICRQS